MYEVNNSAMLAIGLQALRFKHSKNPKEALKLVEEYFLSNIKYRVKVFNEWLIEHGLPTDLMKEENVRVVDGYMLENMQYYEVKEASNGPGEIFGYGSEVYPQFRRSSLTPKWESLFLDFALKIGDDYVSSNSNWYWGIQDFFPGNALSYGGIHIFLRNTGNDKSSQEYYAFLNVSYAQRIVNPDKVQSIIDSWKNLTARYEGDRKAVFIGGIDYSKEISAVIKKKEIMKKRFLLNINKTRGKG